MSTKLAFKVLFMLLLSLFSLSWISDLAAQEDEETADVGSGDRLNIAQTVTLSEQVSQFGKNFYPVTNIFSYWNTTASFPKSAYMFDLGLGGHLYNGSTSEGRRFGIYTSLLNSFDFATVHRLSRKWSLAVTDSFFYYPDINRYGYGSLLQYDTAVNGQVGTLDSFKNFKISPFGAMGPQKSKRFGSTALAAAGSSAQYSGFGPGFGYYGGYYPLFLGSLENDFTATLDYAINSRSTLDFSYDNSFLDFKGFGAFKSQSVTTQYGWRYSRKGSLSFAYSIGRFLFKEPILRGQPRTPEPRPEVLEKAKLANRMRLDDPEPENDKPYRPGLTHTVTVGTEYQLTPDIELEFSVGPSVTTSNEGNFVYLDFTTLASLSKTFKKGTLSAEYFRFVGSSYGYGGAALTQGAILAYDRSLSRRLVWSSSGTYFHFTDIFGIFSENCDPFLFGDCGPSASDGKQSSVSGVFLMTNLYWRMTKRVNMNLGLSYFKGNAGRFGPFFIPGEFVPYGGGAGLYNHISFDYPLQHNLRAFIAYSFISSDFLQSKSSYGNSLAIGISHTTPSIFKIGRRR